MTHAFFKALLFLGAGSVILGMHHEQDTDRMGGLRRLMPVTHATFLIGVLAIAGAPLFSGFFSKDEILLATYLAHDLPGHTALYWIGVLTDTRLTGLGMGEAVRFAGCCRLGQRLEVGQRYNGRVPGSDSSRVAGRSPA